MFPVPVSAARAAFAVVLASLGCATAAAQTPPWQNDWTVTAPAALIGNFAPQGVPLPPQAPIVATPDGELMLRTTSQSGDDDQIVRFDAAGNVRWRVNLGGFVASENTGRAAMLGRADGGAWLAVQDGIALASVDANGSVLWQTDADVSALALDGSALIVQGCNTLRAFDGASGQLLWEHMIWSVGMCVGPGLMVVDATGAIYAAFYTPSASSYVVAKYSSAGQLQWQTTQAGIDLQLIGVAGGLLYYTDGGSRTWALHASNGALAWSAGGVALGLAGAPAEIVVTSASLSRLSALDGTPRWSIPLNGYNKPFLAYSGASGNKIVSGATQLDADSGNVEWTATLPTVDGDGNSLTLISAARASDGEIVFGLSPSPGAPVFQRVDAASGAVGTAVPLAPAAQGLAGVAEVVGTQTVVNTAAFQTGAGWEFEARALDTASGSPRWQASALISPYPKAMSAYTGNTIAGDAAIGTVTANLGLPPANAAGSVWVAAFDLATGNKRWETALGHWDPATVMQNYTNSNDPISDADGNVIVKYADNFMVYSPQWTLVYQNAQSVAKLSAADGSVLWRHDDIFPGSADQEPFPTYAFVVGNDVYLTGPFAAPHENDKLLKLSGADGSVVWSSNAFSSFSDVRAAVDGNLIVDGSGGQAELDAQTGAMLWTNADTFSCVQYCSAGGGAVVLPNGDSWSAGQNGSRPFFAHAAAHAGATLEIYAFDQADTHQRQSYAYTLNAAADGTLWTRITREYYYGKHIHYLAQFDPVSHTLLRQQALQVYSADTLLDYSWLRPLSAPAGERLLVQTAAHHLPQPQTLGTALLDTTVTANGNLALQFSTDRKTVSPGNEIQFLLHVTYTGDAPITGARLLADFPWVGHATGVVCTPQGAANCVLDLRADTLVATFDLQPGGSVDVSGRMRSSDSVEKGILSAIVSGPLGLNELDPSDNAAQTTVIESLFADGFE